MILTFSTDPVKNLIDNVRAQSLTNLSFIMTSISNFEMYLNNASDLKNTVKPFIIKISDSATTPVDNVDIEKIDGVAKEFFSKDLLKRCKVQQYETLSNKLETLWIMLQEVYKTDPKKIVDCVVKLVEKKIPRNLSPEEKKEFMNTQLSKFSGTSKNVNALTDSIFKDVKADFQEKKLDALSICGILLSFVVNSQTHLYFVMENIKEAVAILGKNYDIEDVFSIESSVIQGKEHVTDIQAIRNAVSHGAFNIEYNKVAKEYEIDFHSTLPGYRFNRMYTGSELVNVYRDYDKLRTFQEFLIRIILLKAQLKIFFANVH